MDDMKHRSRFAAGARRLDPRVLSALRLDEVMFTLCDVVVTICGVLLDPDDPRSWQDRMEECFTSTLDDVDPDMLIQGLEVIARDDAARTVQTWIQKTRKVGYIAFARRMLGAAEFNRLEKALKEDAAVVALAVRRGVRAVMPFAVAWEDAIEVMSGEQIATFTTLDLLGMSAVKLVVDLDHELGERMIATLPMEVTAAGETDLTTLSLNDLAAMMETLRQFASEDLARRVEQTNSNLLLKIEGARDALMYSADGVSQAANSLIELIDRLLREAFTTEEVLAWVDAELPEDASLIWNQGGSRHPTKRAQALCFLYGGQTVARQPTKDDDGTGTSFVHEVLARVIVSAREKLQGLKHADSGTDDFEAMRRLLVSVEAVLMLGLRLGLLARSPKANRSARETPESQYA